MKRWLWSVLSAVLMLIPAAAFAAQGYTVATVNMLAGPDPQYPLIYTLDAGTPVDVQGCTEGWEWCDVTAAGNRGWVAGPYIEYLYNNQPVLVADYGARIGIPVVAFTIGAYWGRYYVNRPFYRDRSRWYARPIPIRPYPGARPPLRPWPGARPPGGHRPPPSGGSRPQPGDGNRPRPPGDNRPQPPGNGNRPQPPGGGNRPQPGNGGRPGQNARPAPRPNPQQQNGNNGNGGG